MSDDAIGPTVTVRMRLEKFDGEKTPGKEPVEVIETVEEVPLAEFLAGLEG